MLQQQLSSQVGNLILFRVEKGISDERGKKRGKINSSITIKTLYIYKNTKTVTKWWPRSEEYTHISIKLRRRTSVYTTEFQHIK